MLHYLLIFGAIFAAWTVLDILGTALKRRIFREPDPMRCSFTFSRRLGPSSQTYTVTATDADTLCAAILAARESGAPV